MDLMLVRFLHGVVDLPQKRVQRSTKYRQWHIARGWLADSSKEGVGILSRKQGLLERSLH